MKIESETHAGHQSSTRARGSLNPCLICEGHEFTEFYAGPIRLGRFGHQSSEDHSVLGCARCGAGKLRTENRDLAHYYESEAYRTEVDGNADAASYFKTHDVDQLRHLGITGTGDLRGKTIADIGAGAGSFLDAVSGFAAEAIAVEPSRVFREQLESRNYRVFPYAENALDSFRGMVDLAVSFSVVEHVENPLTFLKSIHALLKTGSGRLIVSTPNAEDFLLDALPQTYRPFYYRRAHIWYFDARALQGLLERAGFRSVRLIPHQRFGLGNFVSWLRDRAPKGQIAHEYITAAMDAVWRAELERTGKSDYLFATATA